MPNFVKFIDLKTDRFPNIPFIFRSSPVAKNMHRIVHRTSTGQKRRNSGLFRMHSELFRSHSERIPAIPFVFRTCTGGAPNGNRGWDGYKKERTRHLLSQRFKTFQRALQTATLFFSIFQDGEEQEQGPGQNLWTPQAH